MKTGSRSKNFSKIPVAEKSAKARKAMSHDPDMSPEEINMIKMKDTMKTPKNVIIEQELDQTLIAEKKTMDSRPRAYESDMSLEEMHMLKEKGKVKIHKRMIKGKPRRKVFVKNRKSFKG